MAISNKTLGVQYQNIDGASGQFYLKSGFHMIVTVGNASATCPGSVGDIWRQSL